MAQPVRLDRLAGVGFFLVNLAGVVGSVVVNSFGNRWFDTWLPEGFTTQWYVEAWNEFGLGQVLWVTFEVALAVVRHRAAHRGTRGLRAGPARASPASGW